MPGRDEDGVGVAVVACAVFQESDKASSPVVASGGLEAHVQLKLQRPVQLEEEALVGLVGCGGFELGQDSLFSTALVKKVVRVTHVEAQSVQFFLHPPFASFVHPLALIHGLLERLVH